LLTHLFNRGRPVLFEVGSEREQEILVERSTRSLQGPARVSLNFRFSRALRFFMTFCRVRSRSVFIANHIADLVRRKYVFSVALKAFEVLPGRQVLSGETNSEHLVFVFAGYVERLAVNDVVALRGELAQHPNEMVETSSMLVERAVLKSLLKHRNLESERLVVKSSVQPICVFLSNGKDRFEHHVFHVAHLSQIVPKLRSFRQT